MLVAQVMAALAAVAGHIWPVFLRFHGGRGVATFFGGLIALCPVAALFGGEVLIIGAGLTRYASLGSIAGVVGTYTILVPLTIMSGFPIEYLFYALAGVIIVFVMHRDNIARLLSGKERKLGDKAETEDLPRLLVLKINIYRDTKRRAQGKICPGLPLLVPLPGG